MKMQKIYRYMWLLLAIVILFTNGLPSSAASSILLEDGDPGKGRAEGYIDAGFYDSISMFSAGDYSHDSRFNGYTIKKGIDVSVYQGDINWKKVKADGIDFAFVRVGYRGYGSEGTLRTDARYESNIKGALDAGIQVGVYFFSQAITKAEAREEANYILQRISKYNISLPVVIDYEYASNSQGLTGRLYNARLSVSDATDICRAFCAAVEAAGYEGMVYANKSMLQNNLNASKIAKDYKIWLANYTNKTNYAGEYDFWQCSSTERVDGINGNVDFDFWYVPANQKPDNQPVSVPSDRVSVSEGLYTITSALNSRMVLDIDGGSIANGANVQLYSSNSSDAQKFYLHDVGDRTYILLSLASGRVLETTGGKNDGENVRQNTYNGSAKQKWWIIRDSDGYYTLISAASGKALDVSGGSAFNGANIQQYSSNGTKAQKFVFESCDQKLLSEQTYVISPVIAEGKALDVNGADRSDGANVQIYQMNGSSAQNFIAKYNGDSTYTFYAEHSQKALDINGAGIANGTNVQQYSGNGTAAQKWLPRSVGNGQYVFFSISSGKALDISNGGRTNGTNVQIYEYNGSDAQKMCLMGERVSVTEGVYTIAASSNRNQVLDISGGSISNRANVQIYSVNNTDAQKFYIRNVGEKTYILISLVSGKVVEVENSRGYNGANICQNAYNGSEYQKWWFVKDEKGYYTLVSAATGKVLDIQNGSIRSGSNVQLYSANGTAAQKYILQSAAKNKLAEGVYIVESALSKSKVLDVSGASRENYANIQLYQLNRTSAQSFRLKYNNDGTYTLIAQNSQKALDVNGAGFQNGTNVQQYTNNGTAAQKWLLKEVGNGYYSLFSASSGKAMDISGASCVNGANVQIYECNGSDAQKFKFVR